MSDAAAAALVVREGWAALPSSLRAADGSARFTLEFPQELLEDVGVKQLIEGELSGTGYEPPTRNLLEKTLRAGDLFIDVGAHFGYFTLQAVTHPAGSIRSLSFEPDPINGSALYRNLIKHDRNRHSKLICAACGDGLDLAPLVSNSSMGHSIRAAGFIPGMMRAPAKFVVVVPLDRALACFPWAAEGRVILKIDAEGYEANVVAGASELLASGRVAVIIWECGYAFAQPATRPRLLEMVESLSARGFTHLRPQSHSIDGPLIPFVADQDYLGNVFSFAAGPTDG
jgi:FkbM family methyltransferase